MVEVGVLNIFLYFSLRLEYNEIERPQDILATCFSLKYKVCTMLDGECAMPGCDHKNVPVQVRTNIFVYESNL